MCARVRRNKYLSYLQPYLAREFWGGGGMENKKGEKINCKSNRRRRWWFRLQTDDDAQSCKSSWLAHNKLEFCPFVCVCAMLMGRDETQEKKTRPLGCFFWSLSGTNERIHYQEENHNNLHKEAQAALDPPTKEFWLNGCVVIANCEYFLLENIC